MESTENLISVELKYVATTKIENSATVMGKLQPMHHYLTFGSSRVPI